MLEKTFAFICAETWLIDVPKNPQPYPCGTKFKLVPKRNGDPLTDWTMKIKRPSDPRFVAPKVQVMKYVVELGGLVYVSLLFGGDSKNLRRMTMSFDCRYPSNHRKSFFFEDSASGLSFISDDGKEKMGSSDGKGSGRPE